jgi:hypothetical protein
MNALQAPLIADSSAPLIADSGAPLPPCTSADTDVRASDAWERERIVRSQFAVGAATSNELVQTSLFAKTCLTSAAVGSPYAEPTNEQMAAQVQQLVTEGQQLVTQVQQMQQQQTQQFTALTQQVTALTQQVTALTQQVTALTQQTALMNESMTGMSQRLHRLEVRQENAMAQENEDAILPILRGAADVPAVFPESRGDLISLCESNIVTLLNFYELPTGGNVIERRRRLARYVGVQIVYLRQGDM